MHGRLLVVDSMGLSSIRCPSLFDAGAWIDEACDGYWDLGDHLRNIRSVAVAGNSRYIATVADNEYRCIVHMVDPFGGRSFNIHKVLEHKHSVIAVAYASDGSTLLVSTADGRVRGWDIDDNGSCSVSANLVHDHQVMCMRASACEALEKALVACLCSDASVWLWDTSKWCVLTKIQARGIGAYLIGAHLMGRGHEGGGGGGSGGRSTWGDASITSDKDADWMGHIGAILDCDVSADGFLLATASQDRTCKVLVLSAVLFEAYADVC